MFAKVCYLNTLHTCLARCVIWIPYINVWQDALSEYLTSMFGKMRHLNTKLKQKTFARSAKKNFVWIPGAKLKIKLSREARRKILSKYLEPDANQARIPSQEPRARAKPRARRESGQDSKRRAMSKSKAKSQTRLRPGSGARSQEERQEPDAHQARIRGQRPWVTQRGRRASGQADAAAADEEEEAVGSIPYRKNNTWLVTQGSGKKKVFELKKDVVELICFWAQQGYLFEAQHV